MPVGKGSIKRIEKVNEMEDTQLQNEEINSINEENYLEECSAVEEIEKRTTQKKSGAGSSRQKKTKGNASTVIGKADKVEKVVSNIKSDLPDYLL